MGGKKERRKMGEEPHYVCIKLTLTYAGTSELSGKAGSTHAPTGIIAWFLSASTANTSLLFRGFKARGTLAVFRGFLRGAILPGICDSWVGERRSLKSSNDCAKSSTS